MRIKICFVMLLSVFLLQHIGFAAEDVRLPSNYVITVVIQDEEATDEFSFKVASSLFNLELAEPLVGFDGNIEFQDDGSIFFAYKISQRHAVGEIGDSDTTYVDTMVHSSIILQEAESTNILQMKNHSISVKIEKVKEKK